MCGLRSTSIQKRLLTEDVNFEKALQSSQIAQGLAACNDSNCLCQIIKKADLCPNCEKIRTLPPFLRVLEILLLNARLGTGTSYARAMLIFKIQMFMLIHFTNLVVQNAAKQGMTKYHPQKSLSNNARSVVKSLPP